MEVGFGVGVVVVGVGVEVVGVGVVTREVVVT